MPYEAFHLKYVGGSWEVLNGPWELSCWSDHSVCHLPASELHHILSELELVAVHDQDSLV